VPERNRVALVTGATGFIGSHLVELLVDSGWRVRCLVRESSVLKWLPVDDITLINGDITRLDENLERAVRNVSVVFHLGGITSAVDDAAYTAVNVGGTRNVVEAIRRHAPAAMLIYASSLAAAGPTRFKRPLNETDQPKPVSPYGQSKLEAERVIEESGIRYTIVRPPAVYGPRDPDILAVFKMAKRGIAFRIAPEGQLLSMIHVEDLVRGMLQAFDRDGRGVYYMTDGMVHTWGSILENISRCVGAKPTVVSVPFGVADFIARTERLRASIMGSKPLLTPGRIVELTQGAWICDDTFARLDIRYESHVSLPEGIKNTTEWYRQAGWL
jgi:nucleoside-diphosphate-sugar epimerase